MESMVDEEKKGLFYVFCHDFKTPLSTIMGMTSLAWSELEDREKVKDRLSRIETASSYLLSMVNDALDYSKIVNGKMSIRREAFSLEKVIEFLNQLLIPHFQKKHQHFEIVCNHVYQDQLVGDFLHLNQILTNLLSNANKYTAVGGSVTLEFNQRPKSKSSLILEMKVSDSGIGMSEEFMKTMFEPYALATEDGECSRESTGLGLFITKNLVTLMNGDVDVVSHPKAGTTFSVRIPFGIPELQKENYRTSMEKRNVESPNRNQFTLKNYNFRGKCVLIAEDNQDMLEITTTMLAATGIGILTAQNGREALNRFRSSPPGSIQMILMDLHMPEMDGLEAAKTIRESDHPDSHKVRILALTASDEAEKESDALNAGIDVFEKKPIDYLHLLNLMEGYLNEERRQREVCNV